MIKSFSKTNIGRKRKINQDYVYTSLNKVGLLDNLFIVCDGMGGHKAGEFASQYVAKNLAELIKNYTANTDPKTILSDNIKTVNKMLFEKARSNSDLRGMGTTVVAATIKGKNLFYANVGDSRLYVASSELKQITVDHSLVEEMIRIGEIRPEEARTHPDRNIITRAIGIEPNVEPDIFDRRIRKNDKYLMCTDGLTSMVDNDTIFKIILCARDTVEATQDLINEANRNGGKDNIGVIIIDPKNRRD